MTAWSRFRTALAAFLLSGCFLTGGENLLLGKGGGGAEDFPNGLDPVASVVEDVVAASAWEQVAVTPQIPELPSLDIFESLVIEPIGLSKRGALGKRAADGVCDTAVYDFDPLEFQLARTGRKIVCHEDDERVRRDTLLFWLRTLPPDSIRNPIDTPAVIQYVQDSAVLLRTWGRMTYKNADKIQTYRAWNFDSLRTPDYGEFVTTTNEGGVRTVQRVGIYGKDGAYQLEGAPPAYYEILKTSGNDTLDWQRLTDADGDSAFWDRNVRGASKGVVLFARKTKAPSESPGTARLTLTMRAEMRHDPAATDSMVPLWYFEQRRLSSGGISAFSLRGAGSDSVLRANDTVLIALDTTYAFADSMATYKADFRLLAGANPANTSEHAMLRLAVERTQRRGKLLHSSSQLMPSVPVPPGAAFVGQVAMQSASFKGDSVWTDGTIDADGMTLTSRVLSKGKLRVYLLKLNRDGTEKEPTVEITTAAEKAGGVSDSTRNGVSRGEARQDTTRQQTPSKYDAGPSPTRTP